MSPDENLRHETERLTALHDLRLLELEDDRLFEKQTRLGTSIFGVPIAMVSLVGAEVISFKSAIGLEAKEAPRENSFCGHALLYDDVFVVPDATQDARFCDSPLVTGPLNVRFYAGAQLKTSSGYKIGTLCLIDQVARPALTETEQRILADLASLVVDAAEESRRARQASEVRLAEVSSRLDGLLESTVDAVISTDSAGRIIDWNEAARRIFGWTASEILGSPITGVFPRYADDRHGKALGAASSARLVDVMGRRKSGKEVPLEVTVTRFDYSGSVVTGLIARDVSERKKLEEERELALQEAELSRERAETANQAKTAFLAMMGHELRTPLNAVIGFSEIIGNEILGPIGNDTYRGYVKDISNSAHHLLGVINHVLDFSTIESGALKLREENLSLAGLLAEVRQLMSLMAAKRGVMLSVEAEPDLPDIRGDRQKLSQILINLVGNAVKFTEPGGSVRCNGGRDAKGRIIITVVDSGIGMSSEDIAHAFDPFYQADTKISRRYEGTGLGLPIASRFAELHDGSLTLQSQPGAGTTATLALPASRAIPGERMPPEPY